MNKRYHSLASIVTCCLLLLLISGCGSSGNKEGDGPVAAVGDRTCVQCHSATKEALTDQTIVAQYQNSSPHNTAALGCEACHGNGGQHQGKGPIEYPAPDAARCTSCHDGTTAPITNAATKFSDSLHANMTIEEGNACRRCHSHEGALLGNIGGLTGIKDVMDNLANQGAVPYTSTYSVFQCSTCHEHGGGLRTVMARNTAAGTATTAPMGDLVNWNPDKNQMPGQFDLCTSCHTMYDYTGNTLLASGTVADTTTGKPATGKVGHHETSWYRVIATTHYDNTATGSSGGVVPATGNVVEGYVLRTKTANPCFDCHGHEARTNTNQVQAAIIAGTSTAGKDTIYTDWAQSGHAGYLLKAKIAAVTGLSGAAAVDSAMVSGTGSADSNTVVVAGSLVRQVYASAWGANHQWSTTLDATSAPVSGLCQKCHTATGFSNYFDSTVPGKAAYDYTNNDFSHLSGWKKATATAATTPSNQAEVLYCWACHSNAGAGVLRNSGQAAITTSEYTYGGAPVVFPNSGKSNACIVCHSGRGNVDTMTTGARSSRFVGHHAPAAGILFNTITHMGYEFAGKDYTNSSHFAHDKIDLTGSGPCASCHMGDKNHKFSILSDDGTAIRSQAVCDTCHSGTHVMTVTTIEEEKAGCADAAKLATAYVKNTLTNYRGAAIAYATATVDDYGALQNSLILSSEAGAFAHNRNYIKRLLFDAIDWLDNGVLNGTITINATAYPDAATWFRADATTGVATRP